MSHGRGIRRELARARAQECRGPGQTEVGWRRQRIDRPDPVAGMTASESRWPVVYYRDPQTNEPVNAFIDALAPKVQVVLDTQIERIALFGPQLPFPHSSQVEGELRELRCHYGNALYRILYRRSNNLFVLLHILEKRTGTIAEADKQIARERWADFKRRMDGPRRPPRAAGHDAP